MKIDNKRQLKDLQEDFIKVFPYLKIEFFKRPHQEGNDSDENEKLDSTLQIREVRTHENTGEILLNEKSTVATFENKMRDEFGLHVQVYRKEHGKWLQTWVTDIWTLEQQNSRSKVMGDKDNLLA